jgi:hypothetical protein
VRVAATADGTLTYVIDLAPEALPAVRGRDLAAAWDRAGAAATAAIRGARRRFRFRRGDGSFIDLALADPDACCWAHAVDGTTGMESSYGLALCLRLLALVDLLARARWAAALLTRGDRGAQLHPALLRTAATAPLTAEAQFDETSFRARIAHLHPHASSAAALRPDAAGAQPCMK